MIALLVALMLSPAADAACVRVQTSVSGSSLEGLMWDGEPLEVLGLGCGVPARYDYIVFRHKDRPGPMIKQLWGQPGDILTVLDNGRFTINGVEAVTPFGKPYYLLGAARSRFKRLDGPLDGYLLLGHPGSDDSARLGLILERDILGYVPKTSVD